MAVKVVVELSGDLYQRLLDFAAQQQQTVEEALASLIIRGLATRAAETVQDWTTPDPVVDRERDAYHALHPMLKEKYLGQYVAIYHGEMIDHDSDAATLHERVDAKYPDEYVLLTRVGKEPIETIYVRSPRLIRD